MNRNYLTKSVSLNKFKSIHGISELKDLSALSQQKLKQSCENAKKILSTKNKTHQDHF